MKALVGAFNQEKALVGAFSVILQPVVEPMDRFTALVVTCFNDTLPHLLTAQVLLLGLLLGAIVGRSSIWCLVPTLGTRIIGNVVTECNPNTGGPSTFLNCGISRC